MSVVAATGRRFERDPAVLVSPRARCWLDAVRVQSQHYRQVQYTVTPRMEDSAHFDADHTDRLHGQRHGGTHREKGHTDQLWRTRATIRIE